MMYAGDNDPFQSITAVYASHKEVSLEQLGKLSALKDRIYGLRSKVNGILVLSTCNRFEVYIDGAEPKVLAEIESMVQSMGVRAKVSRGRQAVERIIMIASGLESRIIGEPEILGQVRREWRNARERGYTSPLLDTVFHQAIVTGKKVRSHTGISRGHASYPSAAVFLAASELGTLNGKKIAVIGAGDAGVGVLRVLCNEFAPSKVVVYTRDPTRAASSVNEACPGVEVRARERLNEDKGFDVAFIAVDDPSGLVIDNGLAGLIVDLSIPPVVEGENVYGLSDLEDVIDNVVEERRKWIGEAEKIIAEDLDRLEERLRQRNISRLLKLLVEYADHLARVESSKSNGCSDTYKILSSYSRKLLHPLIVGLRETASKAWRLDDFIRILEENYLEKLGGER